MAITYIPDPAKLVEVGFRRETTYGTWLAPDTQVAHSGVSWGRGHTLIEAVAATGTVQNVITHTVRGTDTPFVNVSMVYSPNTQTILNELITGSTEATNKWLIADRPNSYSVGVNVQRAASISTWQFAGCYAQSVTLDVQVGTPMTAQVGLIATSLVDPQSAAGSPTFPALTPTVSAAPFVLKDLTFKHSATSTFSGAAVPVRGVTMEITRGVVPWHASGSCEPNALVPTEFRCTGSIAHSLSSDLWSDATNGFQDLIAKESDGGFTTRYLEFVFVSGGVTASFTLPVKLDIGQFDATDPAGVIDAPITFTAAGDDATPTIGTVHVEDA